VKIEGLNKTHLTRMFKYIKEVPNKPYGTSFKKELLQDADSEIQGFVTALFYNNIIDEDCYYKLSNASFKLRIRIGKEC